MCFSRSGETGSHRLDTVAMPACAGLCRRMDALWCDTGPAFTGAGRVLFGGSGRPVPAARSSRLCPHAWGFADERALSGTRRAMLARGRSVWTGLEGQLTPLGHRGYARMRGGFAVEWMLSGARKAPLARGRGLFGRDGKGGPAFLSGRAILSEVFIGSCGGRGLSERGREWGFGGSIRMRSGRMYRKTAPERRTAPSSAQLTL